MTDEQMVADRKILPRKYDSEKNYEFEYGERLDWFLSERTIPDQTQEEQMWDAIKGAVRKIANGK